MPIFDTIMFGTAFILCAIVMYSLTLWLKGHLNGYHDRLRFVARVNAGLIMYDSPDHHRGMNMHNLTLPPLDSISTEAQQSYKLYELNGSRGWDGERGA